MKSLENVLDILSQYSQGSLQMSEEIADCQRILRESEVLGELENGNVYVLRYSEDNQLYALRNYNTGMLTYISTYDEYVDQHRVDEDEENY